MEMKLKQTIPALFVAGGLAATTLCAPAQADAGQVIVAISAPLTPVTLTIGGVVTVIGHEVVGPGSKKPFSNKGEGAKAGTAARNWVGHRTGLQKHGKWLGNRLGIKF
jgi:hypothetical protein